MLIGRVEKLQSYHQWHRLRNYVPTAPSGQSSSTQPILSVSGIPSVALSAIEGIDPDEVQKIVKATPNYSSRRVLCQALFGLSGGAPYNKVKLVCDALGLLNGNQPLQQAA
ncbi:hypothetical protein Hgul01_04817 [Herpetosiphon gulosus]|uniref:Uncharacterized protein n=1 Tax=Herpetosiphon gulosus TaxID=1973496 RepID=A0ABP9X8U9_9CHLR